MGVSGIHGFQRVGVLGRVDRAVWCQVPLRTADVACRLAGDRTEEARGRTEGHVAPDSHQVGIYFCGYFGFSWSVFFFIVLYLFTCFLYGVRFWSNRVVFCSQNHQSVSQSVTCGGHGLLRDFSMYILCFFSFDKPDKMRDLTRELWSQSVGPSGAKGGDASDSLLQRLTIIGEILSFR